MPDWGRIGTAAGTWGLSELWREGQKLAGDPMRQGDDRFVDVDRTGQLAELGGYGSQRFRDDGALRGQLQRQVSGQESLSGEQLRQGLQQNVAAQQSMAAGARGGNQAMAARGAAMNSANLGAGLSGQQAMAGIAERQAAAQGLAGLRGQDLQAALGSLGTIEQQRGQRYAASLGVPSQLEGAMGAASAAGAAYAASDVRLKTDIGDGSTDARELIRSLTPQAFRYRDADRNGAGEHIGIMAQDLERTPAGRSMVSDTPGGKQIDGGKLATGLAAVAADLDRRVADIERRGLDDIERRQSPARVGRRPDGGYLGPTSARTENERVLRLVPEGMRSGMGGRR
jgi:hypothetical protein